MGCGQCGLERVGGGVLGDAVQVLGPGELYIDGDGRRSMGFFLPAMQ